MLARIRAVFADAQTEALDQLFDVINAARDLAPDSDFQACYDLVMASSGPEVETWINFTVTTACLLYTSPSPRDRTRSRMPSSA